MLSTLSTPTPRPSLERTLSLRWCRHRDPFFRLFGGATEIAIFGSILQNELLRSSPTLNRDKKFADADGYDPLVLEETKQNYRFLGPEGLNR
ncbi:hypothetical protein BC936DRAFT_146829 [Jimgerdemannia flammicorona]|uniref:Uncharacterized protein n=1 Tax=Jimgerdemannia flammicorona TaxID=994334 RepID=A0A433D6S3_9FUNG|nr:hypothetical protein BC936DRAFT_146829 [Jimgerdemannia flammicorona]